MKIKQNRKEKDIVKRILKTFLRGLKNSVKALKFVLQIVLPVAIIVLIIKNTPLINIISTVMKPFMSLIGLSGEASLPLFLGMISGTGESAGAIIALQLPVREITIIAVMVGLCNSLIGETLIYRKISRHYLKTAAIRLIVSFATGYMIKFVV